MSRTALLFALAAALPCAAGAEPLPPVESVRACPRQGPGFYQIPGSSTCVRIAGRVASDYTAGSRRAARDEAGGFRSEGRVSLDTRTDTAYGPLRSFVRVRVRSGPSDR